MNAVLDHLLGHGLPMLVLPAPGSIAPADVARRHALDPSELVWTEVVITAQGPVAMSLGAGRSLDLDRARAATGDPSARLATHDEVRAFSRGSEIGAVPPLSRFLQAPVYVDTRVAMAEHVVFPTGVVSLLVCMLRDDLFTAEPVHVAALSGGAADDPEPASSDLSVVAPTRRALFDDEPLVPYHLRAG
jgi:prolyl-tRNA editing enzyme YbaK/EbsC (Cys-tRNA(Pro) deacylase)